MIDLQQFATNEAERDATKSASATVDEQEDASVATATPESTEAQPERRVDKMPPWKVLLHNDDVNVMEDVVRAIRQLTPLTLEEAVHRMLEAHKSGVALLLTTHREHAELIQEQFRSKRLRVTIEADA